MNPNIDVDHADNEIIIELIRKRLEFGMTQYGHGVRVHDDDVDWEIMMMEEALDGMVYAAAQLLRLKQRREKQQPKILE